MPYNCPLKKENYFDCILCLNNREGYCWGLCPPKECKRALRDILTLGERISLLEDKLENRDIIECAEIENLGGLQEIVQKKLDEFQKLINLFQGKFQYLSILSKKIVTLEESSKSKGIKRKSSYD